ncbi:alpha/beta fold hydrolase [Streptomyces amritsarensis]|uniref:alpha/beta fold hydrolase n=1 Tax=Streptomyces amritsarensis TaxID=681158 RepID=UPI00367A88B1
MTTHPAPSGRTTLPAAVAGAAAPTVVRPDRFHKACAQGAPRSVTRVLAAGQRPLDASAFSRRCTAAAWRTLPSWVLLTGQDRGTVPERPCFRARRAGSRTTEVSASHLPVHSRPHAVAPLVRAAARTALKPPVAP